MNYELREQMAMVIRGLLENRHGMRVTDRQAPFTKRTAHPWRMEMMNAVRGGTENRLGTTDEHVKYDDAAESRLITDLPSSLLHSDNQRTRS